MRNPRGQLRIVVQHEHADIFWLIDMAAHAPSPESEFQAPPRRCGDARRRRKLRRPLPQWGPQASLDRFALAQTIALRFANEKLIDGFESRGVERGDVARRDRTVVRRYRIDRDI